MTGDHHGNIVAFSSKIAVEQAGDETGMSPTKPGIIVKGPSTGATLDFLLSAKQDAAAATPPAEAPPIPIWRAAFGRRAPPQDVPPRGVLDVLRLHAEALHRHFASLDCRDIGESAA